MSRKMKRMIAWITLALLTVLALALPAAADTGYTGVIDPETGEPYDGESARIYGDRIPLSEGMYYDWSTYDYVYPVGSTLGEVHATAADGMVLTSPVTIRINGEAAVTVYCGGSEYTGSLDRCAAVGDYVVSAQVNGQTRRLMGFTLVGSTTNAIRTFVVPDSFYVVSAERDGENVYMDRYSVDMEPEGSYRIEYACSDTDISYRLETSVDRTPPALVFKGKLDRQGRIRSRLDFSGVQSGDRIWLSRSGTAVTPELNSDGTGAIYDPGNYVMIVTDAAGNSVEYDFIILQYLNLQSWIFFLIVLAVVVAVVGYIVVQRRRLKIG